VISHLRRRIRNCAKPQQAVTSDFAVFFPERRTVSIFTL
jgi:hypothetical protein